MSTFQAGLTPSLLKCVSSLSFSRSYCQLANSVVSVYTDGCCHFNGHISDCQKAGIGVFWGPNHPDNVSEPLNLKLKTNNRAELFAAMRAVEIAQQRYDLSHTQIIIHTDSQFLIDSMTKWIYQWERNGWLGSTQKPIALKDEFQTLLRCMNRYRKQISWRHVPRTQNVEADKLAKAGAQKSSVNAVTASSR